MSNTAMKKNTKYWYLKLTLRYIPKYTGINYNDASQVFQIIQLLRQQRYENSLSQCIVHSFEIFHNKMLNETKYNASLN